MSSKSKRRRAMLAELQKSRLELNEIRSSLLKAYECFNYSDDPALTEASIYEISSLRARYDFAFRRIKLSYKQFT